MMPPLAQIMSDAILPYRRPKAATSPFAAGATILTMSIGLAACTNPYDPGQRALGGAVLGAGTGAAIGAVAGGGHGAAIGAIAGGALGAAGGIATTPYYSGAQPSYYPQPGYYQQPSYYQQPGYYPQPGYYQPPGYYGQPGYYPRPMYYQRWSGF